MPWWGSFLLMSYETHACRQLLLTTSRSRSKTALCHCATQMLLKQATQSKLVEEVVVSSSIRAQRHLVRIAQVNRIVCASLFAASAIIVPSPARCSWPVVVCGAGPGLQQNEPAIAP